MAGTATLAYAQATSGSPSTTGGAGSTLGQPGMASGSSSVGGSMAPMDESQVKSMLQAQGYADVSDVERDGDRFELQAKKDGKIQKLEVDSRTGAVKDSETKRLTESSIEDSLKKEGYSEVSDVERDGDEYKASAKKDGKNYKLEIDAKDGKVKDREES